MCLICKGGMLVRKFIFVILPPLQTQCYNKPLLKKHNAISKNKEWYLRFDLEKADPALVLNDLDALIAGQVDQRKALDEKARALLITLTVTVAGTIALFQFGNDAKSIDILSNHLLLVAGCLVGLLYLLLAAIMCVASLDTQSFAIPQPIRPLDELGGEFEYYVLEDGDRIQFQAEAYTRNNLILSCRNNILVSSLHCIRNGLVLLLLCVVVFGGFAARSAHVSYEEKQTIFPLVQVNRLTRLLEIVMID